MLQNATKTSLTGLKLKLALWLAQPYKHEPSTLEELAEEVGRHRATLWRWKREPGFMDEVQKIALGFALEDFPKVLRSIIREAMGGNVQAQKLYLEYVMKWIRTEEVRVKQLPAPLKEVIHSES